MSKNDTIFIVVSSFATPVFCADTMCG